MGFKWSNKNGMETGWKIASSLLHLEVEAQEMSMVILIA